MVKTILLLIFLCVNVFTFDDSDSLCNIPIQIVQHRFDNLYSEIVDDTCCFVNYMDKERTWVVYKDREIPYRTDIYSIIILTKEKKQYDGKTNNNQK